METLDEVASKVTVCALCDLSLKRKNAVPGEGNKTSKLLILGEAPGRYEDAQGRPFVGLSGRFLDKYLKQAGIRREEAFVTNAVKCRPPNNRKPKTNEIAACRIYLISQISIIEPKMVLALGTSAASSLGIKFDHLAEIRGRLIEIEFGGKKLNVFITYHPSFPMRFTKPRDTFLSDLKKVKELLGD